MTEEPGTAHRTLPGPDDAVITIRRSTGGSIALTLNDYRLALLGLVDFEGDWDAMRVAARYVKDGESKEAIIRERLVPVAGHLSVLLARGVDGLELLAARHWFRNDEL